MDLPAFQNSLGYQFRDEHLLVQALTHRSYAYEHNPGFDNQRLEFLGDAILDFVIGEALYLSYPSAQEGELSRLRSRLVCETALAQIAHSLGFESMIRMGKSEILAGGQGRPGTLADAYESVIGAVYLDGGFESAKSYILFHHSSYLADPDGDWLALDAKSRLQECAQARHIQITYEILGRSGPEHSPCYEAGVFVEGTCIGKGTGHNKKEAQQAAAAEALNNYFHS